MNLILAQTLKQIHKILGDEAESEWLSDCFSRA